MTLRSVMINLSRGEGVRGEWQIGVGGDGQQTGEG